MPVRRRRSRGTSRGRGRHRTAAPRRDHRAGRPGHRRPPALRGGPAAARDGDPRRRRPPEAGVPDRHAARPPLRGGGHALGAAGRHARRPGAGRRRAAGAGRHRRRRRGEARHAAAVARAAGGRGRGDRPGGAGLRPRARAGPHPPRHGRLRREGWSPSSGWRSRTRRSPWPRPGATTSAGSAGPSGRSSPGPAGRSATTSPPTPARSSSRPTWGWPTTASPSTAATSSICLDAREALGRDACLAIGHADRARLFGFLGRDERLAPYDRDRVWAVFGLDALDVPRHGHVARPVEVRFARMTGGPVPPGPDVVALKRDGIWANPVRNRQGRAAGEGAGGGRRPRARRRAARRSRRGPRASTRRG